MAEKRKTIPEVTICFKEDGEELEQILKQSFQIYVQKKLHERETKQ